MKLEDNSRLFPPSSPPFYDNPSDLFASLLNRRQISQQMMLTRTGYAGFAGKVLLEVLKVLVAPGSVKDVKD